MKAQWTLLAWMMAGIGAGMAAEWSRPGLLTGRPVPAGEAVAEPPWVMVNAVSDDGRMLLVTSTSDLLAPEDDNQTTDVFVFNRAEARLTAVSAAAGGDGLGNGASLGADFVGEAGRVLFLSRASNLVAGDTNGVWDVFVRDLTAGETRRVSVFPDTDPGATPFSMPQVSRDGRRVLFESPVTNLAGVAGFPSKNLFVRDLEEGTVQMVSTGWSEEIAQPAFFRDGRLAADGSVVTFLGVGSLGPRFPRGVVREIESGATQVLHPEGVPPHFIFPSSPVGVSGDGRWAAWRMPMALGNRPENHTNAVFLHEVATGANRILAQTPLAFGWGTNVTAIAPVLSAAGEAVAFCLPRTATTVGGIPTGPAQVLHHDTLTGVTTLVSADRSSGEPVAAEAIHPRISADGRFVAYLSPGANLVEGFEEVRWRVLWWDRETGANRVLLELPADPAAAMDAFVPVFSSNGRWLAVGAPSAIGEAPSVRVADLLAGTLFNLPLPLARLESSTGPAWLMVDRSGVSADGRRVAFASPDPEPPGRIQVWLLDTHTGERERVSVASDGGPGDAHSSVPGLSADGRWVAFASFAANLTDDGDAAGRAVYLRDRLNGTTRWVGPVLLPTEGEFATEKVWLSADGRYVAGYGGEGWLLWVVLRDTVTGWEVALGDTFRWGSRGGFGSRAGSGDGTRLAVLGQAEGVWTVRVLDVPVYGPAAGQAGQLLERPARESALPALSRDGRRVAFQRPVPDSPAMSEVAVVAVDTGEDLLVWNTMQTLVSEVVLSDDGRRVAWVQGPSAHGPAHQQVWWGDLETGAVALASVAADGTTPSNGNARFIDLSADGRYLAFSSLGDNLVSEDNNQAKDVFLRDLETGGTLLVSRTDAGTPGNRWSPRSFFSADGRSLFFLSHASNLAEGDLNQGADLFKVEIVGGRLLLVIQRNLTGGGARLLWNGTLGRQYRVEFSATLEAPDWQPVLGLIGEDFSLAIGTDGTRRFYRVVELE